MRFITLYVGTSKLEELLILFLNFCLSPGHADLSQSCWSCSFARHNTMHFKSARRALRQHYVSSCCFYENNRSVYLLVRSVSTKSWLASKYTTPRVLAVSTVAVQCRRWHLWHDFIYPVRRSRRSSNRGRKKGNGVNMEEADIFRSVPLIERRVLFKRNVNVLSLSRSIL